METSLENLGEERQFEHALDSIRHVVDAFHGLIQPTHLRYEVADVANDDGSESTSTRQIEADRALTASDILNSMRDTAKEMSVPSLAVFELTGSVRVTLADGVHFLSPSGDSDALQGVSSDAVGPSLEVALRQHGIMKSCVTELITITGHSDHWLDGSRAESYLPAPTPIARLNQARLETAVSQLYDAVSPTQLSFEGFENADDLITPPAAMPGFDSLWTRQATEWVLSVFNRYRPNSETLRIEYGGDRLDPLVESPDHRVRLFLETTVNPDATNAPTTAIAVYPEVSTTFERDGDDWTAVDPDD